MFEKKYKFVFLRKEYSTMNFVGMLKTNNLSNIIRFKNKSYVISMDLPSFSELKTKTYILDFDTGSQLKFDEIKAILNPKELDMIISNQVIKELTLGAIANTKDKIINMILGAIIGGLLSALLMFVYMNQKIDEIYKSFSFNGIGGLP